MTRWILHLRPLPSDVPDAVRIRGLLKVALRRFKLRALDVAQLPEPPRPVASTRRQAQDARQAPDPPKPAGDDAQDGGER